MDPAARSRLIDRYRDGVRAVTEAVASLSLTDLDRHAGNAWSAREVIHHLADAEIIEAQHLRRVLAEEAPDLPWADEEEYARRLHYDRSIESSLAAFQAVVLANAGLLASLTDAEWRRVGLHSREGRRSVEAWLQKMAEHAHDHTAQLLRAAGHDVI
jgi:hypothetical protein